MPIENSCSDLKESTKIAGDKEADVCRDFLWNVCKRGKKCKYKHPPTTANFVLS